MNPGRIPHFVALAWIVAASGPVLTRGPEDAVGPSSPPQPARLWIAAERLLLEEPGRDPVAFDNLEDLVRTRPGLEGTFSVVEDPERRLVVEPRPDDVVDGRSGREGKTIRIQAGEIPVLDFVRFLADYTGLPVVHDSSQSDFDRTIRLPAPVDDADDEIVKHILKANGFRVRKASTFTDRPLLVVETLRGTAPATEPETHPIIVVGDETGRIPSATERTKAGDTDEKETLRVAEGPEQKPLEYGGVLLTALPKMVQAHLDLREGEGLLVREIQERTTRRPSQTAPLELYDVLTHVDMWRVSNPKQFLAAMESVPPGSTFRYRLLRKGWAKIVTATKAR